MEPIDGFSPRREWDGADLPAEGAGGGWGGVKVGGEMGLRGPGESCLGRLQDKVNLENSDMINLHGRHSTEKQ